MDLAYLDDDRYELDTLRRVLDPATGFCVGALPGWRCVVTDQEPAWGVRIGSLPWTPEIQVTWCVVNRADLEACQAVRALAGQIGVYDYMRERGFV